MTTTTANNNDRVPRAQTNPNAHDTSPASALLALALALSVGCPDATPNTVDDDDAPVCPTTATPETVRVFEGLAPHCAGCHASGARGYFASVDAFQSLIISDPRFVTPGAGATSELVLLLQGTSRGAFAQMPPSGPTYADLAGTAVSVDDVIALIDGLSAQARDPTPDPLASRVARVSAEHVQRALYQQLGLSSDDFFIPAFEFGIEMAEPRDEGQYPLTGTDDFPAARQRATAERHQGLGGGSVLAQRPEDRTPSLNFVHNLVQLSQAWCRRALTKEGNTALFPSPAARDDESPEAIGAGLSRFSLLFHSEPLSADDEAVYRALYQSVRAEEGNTATTAWTAVCSAFIRHPRWVFY